MEKWVLYAFVSMVFAGITSVLAKFGLAGISADLGLAVRTVFVFVLVIVFALWTVPDAEVESVTGQNIAWLAASALTTTISWIFYYRAIKAGNVSTVALIDKGSVIVAVLLAWLLLQEQMTRAKAAGALLIVSGLLVIARSQ